MKLCQNERNHYYFNDKMISSIFQTHTVIVLIILHNSNLEVDCHGYLIDPPARTSAWRAGFKTPKNYDDNQMFCGGIGPKSQSGGKCGICGDPYNGPRDSEVGEKWVTKPPTIVRHYKVSEWIVVNALLTTNHKGYMEFRLCPAHSDTVEVTQECLNDHTLEVEGSNDRKYYANRSDTQKLKLPDGLTCKRCVLQWDYTAGNSWNAPPAQQETFRGCADVEISETGKSVNLPVPSVNLSLLESTKNVAVPVPNLTNSTLLESSKNIVPLGSNSSLNPVGSVKNLNLSGPIQSMNLSGPIQSVTLPGPIQSLTLTAPISHLTLPESSKSPALSRSSSNSTVLRSSSNLASPGSDKNSDLLAQSKHLTPSGFNSYVTISEPSENFTLPGSSSNTIPLESS